MMALIGVGHAQWQLASRVAARLAALLLLSTTSAACAGAVEEVPFITTPDRVTVAMLDLARVGPMDHVIDLGSGDGRIVITAARRHGASGLGVEIVPDLVERSRRTAEQAGVASRVRFEVQDLFQTDLHEATVVTMYLLPDVNLKLRPALLMLWPGTRIVSHDWDMGDWPPDESVTLEVPEKAIGRERLSRVHLWVVPAPMQGLWCQGHAPLLRIDTEYQSARVTFVGPVDSSTLLSGRVLSGRIRGPDLRLESAELTMGLHWSGEGQLILRRAEGAPFSLQPCSAKEEAKEEAKEAAPEAETGPMTQSKRAP